MAKVFYLVSTNLLIPVLMILFGVLFKKKIPDSINWAFGYRTTMSMKNKDTWNFAHQYCGRLWIKIGVVLAIISLIIIFIIMEKSPEYSNSIIGKNLWAQTICMVLSIIPTEIALYRNFDKMGNRKIK